MDLKHELAKATKVDPEIGRILTVAAEMFVADRGAPPEDLLQLINYIKPVIEYLEQHEAVQ
jgi:hypothetical protein